MNAMKLGIGQSASVKFKKVVYFHNGGLFKQQDSKLVHFENGLPAKLDFKIVFKLDGMETYTGINFH